MSGTNDVFHILLKTQIQVLYSIIPLILSRQQLLRGLPVLTGRCINFNGIRGVQMDLSIVALFPRTRISEGRL